MVQDIGQQIKVVEDRPKAARWTAEIIRASVTSVRAMRFLRATHGDPAFVQMEQVWGVTAGCGGKIEHEDNVKRYVDVR